MRYPSLLTAALITGILSASSGEALAGRYRPFKILNGAFKKRTGIMRFPKEDSLKEKKDPAHSKHKLKTYFFHDVSIRRVANGSERSLIIKHKVTVREERPLWPWEKRRLKSATILSRFDDTQSVESDSIYEEIREPIYKNI